MDFFLLQHLTPEQILKVKERSLILSKQGLILRKDVLEDRFVFAILGVRARPVSSKAVEYFCIDDEFVYTPYAHDFGPLNLGMLFRYCQLLKEKLRSAELQNKLLVQWTTTNEKKRINAAFLIASYLIIYEGMDAYEAFGCVVYDSSTPPHFIYYRDAVPNRSMNFLMLLDVLEGLQKAHYWKLFDFDDFDLAEYEYYEKTYNGGLNWVVPQKMIGFCNPGQTQGVITPPPQFNFEYFRQNNVKVVVRLNDKEYEESVYTEAGFEHKDLSFADGNPPTDAIMKEFLELAHGTNGALAVHCKVGIGRTGTLIGGYLMNTFGFSAREAVGYLRVCRPGSVFGIQQYWLEQKEAKYVKIRAIPPRDGNNNNNELKTVKFPIYSIQGKCTELVESLADVAAASSDEVNEVLETVEEPAQVGGQDQQGEVDIIPEKAVEGSAEIGQDQEGDVAVIPKMGPVEESAKIGQDQKGAVAVIRKKASDYGKLEDPFNGQAEE